MLLIKPNRWFSIVGYVDDVRTVFAQYDILPPEIDYPEELISYLGRKVWKS